MDRGVLVTRLKEMGTYLDLLGANPFKVRAFLNGARVIDTFEGSLDNAINEGTLKKTKGIGPGLLFVIEEFWETGQISELEELKSQVPGGLLEMLAIPGLGAKKVKAIWEKLEITQVGELEYACRENRLKHLEGFGQKSQDKILQGIEFLKKFQGQFLYSDGILEAELLVSYLEKSKAVEKIQIAGSLRRKKEIIKDIDILVSSSKPQQVTKRLKSYPGIDSVTASGDTKTSVVLKMGMAVDVRVVTKSQFPFALMYFTGSKEHNTSLRAISKSQGLKLNEYGLFKGQKSLSCKSEEEIYKALGLNFVPPELRENTGELKASESGQIPQLIERQQIKGVFHCHTKDSDGSNTLEEMVAGARDLGFQYIGISDHSKSSVIANGMNQKRLLDQFKHIEEVQKKFKDVRIFKGVEADILSDGSLDYPDSFLKKFDFVIGSVHGALGMSEDKMTKRVLKALKNPYLDILGHPTGRLLLARKGVSLRMNEVIESAGKHGVVIEINGSRQRLDLDWRWGRFAKDQNVMVSINPDAHSVAGLEDVDLGVGIARKAWMTTQNVLNSLPVEKVLEKLRRNN